MFLVRAEGKEPILVLQKHIYPSSHKFLYKTLDT